MSWCITRPTIVAIVKLGFQTVGFMVDTSYHMIYHISICIDIDLTQGPFPEPNFHPNPTNIIVSKDPCRSTCCWSTLWLNYDLSRPTLLLNHMFSVLQKVGWCVSNFAGGGRTAGWETKHGMTEWAPGFKLTTTEHSEDRNWQRNFLLLLKMRFVF